MRYARKAARVRTRPVRRRRLSRLGRLIVTNFQMLGATAREAAAAFEHLSKALRGEAA